MDYSYLIKDDSILAVVKHLADKYGNDSFKITDYWEGDLMAIGISNNSETYLIYISTYNQAKERYFVSLEKISKEDESYREEGDFEEVDLKELEILFKEYLQIKNNEN